MSKFFKMVAPSFDIMDFPAKQRIHVCHMLGHFFFFLVAINFSKIKWSIFLDLINAPRQMFYTIQRVPSVNTVCKF